MKKDKQKIKIKLVDGQTQKFGGDLEIEKIKKRMKTLYFEYIWT